MIATPARGRSRARGGARCGGGSRDAPSRSSSSRSTVGGGSLPGETLPSVGLASRSRRSATEAARRAPRRETHRSSAGSRTTRSCSICGPSSRCRRRTCVRRIERALARPAHDGRRRHGRSHRSRQDHAAARADRHRRGPAARGAAARDDDRRRLRAPRRSTTARRSTSSTCRGTTSWSATCSSAPARSTPRCWSSPPTTGRAPRPSSTSRCSTRSAIAPALAVVTKIDAVRAERVAEVVAASRRPPRVDVAGRLAGPRRVRRDRRGRGRRARRARSARAASSRVRPRRVHRPSRSIGSSRSRAGAWS